MQDIHHRIVPHVKMFIFLAIVLISHILWIKTRAEPLNLSLSNKANNSSLVSDEPTVYGCYTPEKVVSFHLLPINYQDCFPVLNDMLLDPNVLKSQEYTEESDVFWEGAGCAVELAAIFPDTSPVEKLKIYRVAIAAALVIKQCIEDPTYELGGLQWVTRKNMFAAQVLNNANNVRAIEASGRTPRNLTSIPSAAATSDDEQSTSSPSTSRKDLVLPTSNLTSVIDPLLLDGNLNSTLGATIRCGPLQTPTSTVDPSDCYTMFYARLRKNPEKSFSLDGVQSRRSESLRSCSIGIWGYSSRAHDTTTDIEVMVMAARILQACVVEQGRKGGYLDIGVRREFYILVSDGVRNANELMATS